MLLSAEAQCIMPAQHTYKQGRAQSSILPAQSRVKVQEGFTLIFGDS